MTQALLSVQVNAANTRFQPTAPSLRSVAAAELGAVSQRQMSRFSGGTKCL